jgi:CheY-like chemotaxis protein
LKILLAEDDKNFGIVLKNELEEERYSVDLVYDGVEAVLKFIDNAYDLVLIDIKMPKLDGISTLRILKKLDPAIPAIVFSGNAGLSDVEETFTVGVIRYFSKPFVMADLKECIKRNCDQ